LDWSLVEIDNNNISNSEDISSNTNALISTLNLYYGKNLDTVVTMLGNEGFVHLDNEDHANCVLYKNIEGIICELTYSGEKK
jgi:hypothetical protein